MRQYTINIASHINAKLGVRTSIVKKTGSTSCSSQLEAVSQLFQQRGITAMAVEYNHPIPITLQANLQARFLLRTFHLMSVESCEVKYQLTF